MNHKMIFFSLLIIFLAVAGCNDDEAPVIPNPEELITTLTYTLSPVAGGGDVTMSFQDLDGDGGNSPVITGGTLAANATYTGVLELLDESAMPAENITEEIEEEDEEHQFFFTSTISGLNVAYSDQDENGNPVGLETTVTTGAAGNGTLTVVLRHEPDKFAAGVAAGDITNAGGETDIEVTFEVEVK